MLSRDTWCSGALAALLAVPSLAHAQPAGTPPVALNRFNPAPAGDRFYGLPSPDAAGELRFQGNIVVDYAHNPLVLRVEGEGTRAGTVVGDQLFLHLDASLALWNRLSVSVSMPFALLQTGDNPTAQGLSFRSPDSAEVGDLRLGARARLWGAPEDAFQVALGGYFWLPTGRSEAGSFVSDGTVRGLPQVILGGRTQRIVWGLAVGPEIRASQVYADVSQGTRLDLGAGLGVLLLDRKLQVGPEASVNVVLDNGAGTPAERTIHAEVLLGGRYRFLRDFEVGIAAGPGLTAGLGTPDVRFVGMVGYHPEPTPPKPPDPDQDGDGIPDGVDACPTVAGEKNDDPKKHGCPPPKDSDGDGIPDEVDACPSVAGEKNDDPKKNGCPPPKDSDGDGIFDEVDACPSVAGVKNDDPKKHGCPKDSDGDGIADSEDACPAIKGIADGDPKKNGCPGDTDGDGITDDQDACPEEKGKPDPDPKQNGCPKTVRVTKVEVLVLREIQFDTAKATIKKVSDPILDEIAQVIAEHPEISKIEVQGHTDSQGPRALNLKLSQARAESVVKALAKRKVDAARLVAKGYGPDVPIDDNKTPAGRQKNRRVQFIILERKAK